MNLEKSFDEFLSKNEEQIKLFLKVYESGESLGSLKESFHAPIYIYPNEFEEILQKVIIKIGEIEGTKDKKRKTLQIIKSSIEEIKETTEFLSYLANISKSISEFFEKKNYITYKQQLVEQFIKNSMYIIEESMFMIWSYYNFDDFSVEALEEFLKPVFIEKKLTSEIIREIREELYGEKEKLVKEIREDKKLPEETKIQVIKSIEESYRTRDGFVKNLTSKKVYAFYFKHNQRLRRSKLYSFHLLDFIDSLIKTYIEKSLKVKPESVYPLFDRAIVIEEELADIPLEDHKKVSIYEIILDKLQLEVIQKLEEKKRKEKNTEAFYKNYNTDRTQIPVPYLISRNNPCLLNSEKIKGEERIKIDSYWSSFIIQATKDSELFDVVDIKNILSILAIKTAYIEHLKENGVDNEEIIKALVLDGVYIPLPLIAEIRDISKQKKNYLKIIETVDKAQNLQIKGFISVDVKGKPLEIKKAFSLISEYEEITFKNKKTLNIKLTPTVAKLLLEKRGKFYNRKLINNIPDNILPLYFFLDNIRLNHNIKEKIISKKNLLINSRLAYGKTAKERPDKVDIYLKNKLDKLKSGIRIDKDINVKILKNWEEMEMYNGEIGIKIIFEEN